MFTHHTVLCVYWNRPGTKGAVFLPSVSRGKLTALAAAVAAAVILPPGLITFGLGAVLGYQGRAWLTAQGEEGER